MHHLTLTLILLSSYLTTLATALPSLNLKLIHPLNNSTLLNFSSPPTCYPRAPYRRPNKLDCVQAIEKIGVDHEEHIFSRTSTDTHYRLPQSFTSGSCRIEIDIGPLLPETSSWEEIYIKLYELMKACVLKGRWMGGGELQFGSFGGLVIKMESTVPPET